MWKILSGLFLGWSLGANDSANIFGTGVATGTVKYRTAIWLTAAFAIFGAVIEGPKCMATVGNLSALSEIQAFGCTLAAALTMGLLTYLAIPASASQSIIGAIIGVGIVTGTADFSKLYKIVSCWLITPISGLALGYVFFLIIESVLNRNVKSITRRNAAYLWGILLAGSYGAYSLGANNVANVTGVYVGSGLMSAQTAAIIGSLSIASGVLTYSKKVMMTVGKGMFP